MDAGDTNINPDNSNNEAGQDFDPIGELMVAQSKKPPQMGDINLRVLTPFQRTLLVIDGTVTKFIEAYTMEPVEIINLNQEVRELTADHVWLDLKKGAEIIAREVLLIGKYRNRVYAYAVSLIVKDRINNSVRKQLEIAGESLGKILLGNQVESRREVLWYGKEKMKELPEAISHLKHSEFISRTYRIIMGGKPIMLINENFPTDIDPTPSQH